jgi:hypothetical protein
MRSVSVSAARLVIALKTIGDGELPKEQSRRLRGEIV